MRHHRKRRRPTYLEVTVLFAAGEVDARILDVGERGFRLSGIPDLYAECEILIRLGPHRLAGRIVWQKDGLTGVMLDASLDPDLEATIRGDASPEMGGRSPRRPNYLSY